MFVCVSVFGLFINEPTTFTPHFVSIYKWTTTYSFETNEKIVNLNKIRNVKSKWENKRFVYETAFALYIIFVDNFMF